MIRTGPDHLLFPDRRQRASTELQRKLMAGEQGFEPWYAGIKIQCLNQLGDSPTQLTACRHWRVFYCLNAAKPNFFTTYNIAAMGCLFSACAFQDFHFAGTFDSTASASTSPETAQNTQAPEPVILASP